MHTSWLLTGGKDGGGDDNACGIDASVKAWKVDGPDIGIVKQIGLSAETVWEVVSLDESRRVVVALMRRGRPMLEIWEEQV